MGVLIKPLLALLTVAGLLSLSTMLVSSTANADPRCHIDESTGKWVCEDRGSDPPGGGGPGKGPTPKQPYDVYRTPACSINGPPPNDPGVMCMGASSACKTRGEKGILMWVFYQWEKDGPWERHGTECTGDTAQKEPTPQQVRSELIERYLLAAKLQTNPVDGRTLINFPTIFYTEQPKVPNGNITILGQPVTVTVTVDHYTWHTGDGDFDSTGPGVPYAKGTDPSTYLTHKYESTGQYSASVSVVYHVTYHVGGGGEHDLGLLTKDSNNAKPIEVVQSRPELGN